MQPKYYNLKQDGLEWLWNIRAGTWRFLATDFENRDHYDVYAKMLAANGINTVMTFGCHYRWDFIQQKKKTFTAMADCVQACHKYGIRVIEHHSASLVASDTARNWRYKGMSLKEFFQVDARKNPARELYAGSSDMFCPNNPLFQRAYCELIQGYIDIGVDGLMSDDVAFRTPYGCVCKYCREKFKKESGYEIPPIADKTFWDNLDSPAYRAFIKFRIKSVGDHNVRLMEINKKLSKRLALFSCCTYGALGAWNAQTDANSYDQCIRGCNLGFTETCSSLDCNWIPDGVCAKAWLAITRAHGVPNLNMYYPHSKEERFFTWALAMTFGHRYYHGTIRRLYPYRTWKEDNAYFEDSFHWEKNHAFLFKKPQSLANIAVLFSTQTRDYYGGPDDNYYTNEWLGWSETLYEQGVLFDVLMDLYLSQEELAKYKVLILPNAACLSRQQVSIIRNYVKGGGIIIGTYQISLCDGDGGRLKDFSLRDVFGIQYVDQINEIDIPYGFLDTPEALAVGGKAADRNFLHGPNTFVRVRPEARILARQMHANVFKDYPFAVLNKFGKGQALYFSGKLGLNTCLHAIQRKEAPLRTKNWTWSSGGAIKEPTEWVDRRDRNALKMIRNSVEYFAGLSLPIRLDGAPRGIVFDAYQVENNHVVLHCLNAMGSTFEDGHLVGAGHKITYPVLNGSFFIQIRKNLIKNRYPTLYSPDLEKPRPLHFTEDEQFINIEIRPEYLKRYSLIALEP